MKVTFIGHASILIESKGIRLLSDPWWKGPCFGAQWWLHPAPYLDAVTESPPDYIYISHGHHDHLHPATLKTLVSPVPKVLVARGLGLTAPLRGLGFEVIEMTDDEEKEVAPGVKTRILRTDGDDSLMVVSDGTETCANINDALHSSSPQVRSQFARLLRGSYGRMDYVFCGYGVASHFPNCYVVPGKDRERTAANRQRYFNQAWAGIIHDLNPRFAFPFAADVVFLEEDLFWSNEPTHNSDRPTVAFQRAYPGADTTVLDIAPGFAIQEGRVVSAKLRQPVRSETLKRAFADPIRRVNRAVAPDRSAIDNLVALIRANVRICQPYLITYDGDYRCLIRFKNSPTGIEIIKRGSEISVNSAGEIAGSSSPYDLIYTTRVSYLTKSLTSEYGHETLFVGSGGIFQYSEPVKVRLDIHPELSLMMRRVTTCPRRRSPRGPVGWIGRTKRLAKRAIGRRTDDLYDLARWTVFTPNDSFCEPGAPKIRSR